MDNQSDRKDKDKEGVKVELSERIRQLEEENLSLKLQLQQAAQFEVNGCPLQKDIWPFAVRLLDVLSRKYGVSQRDMDRILFRVSYDSRAGRTVWVSFLGEQEGLIDPVKYPMGIPWENIAACELAAKWWPERYEAVEFGEPRPLTLLGLERRIVLLRKRLGDDIRLHPANQFLETFLENGILRLELRPIPLSKTSTRKG